MTVRTAHGVVLLVGAVGSFAFVLFGVWILVSRVWSVSFTQTLEVLVAAPFLAGWVLSPVLWAARPQPERPESRPDDVRALVAATVVVAVAACAYTTEFILRPAFFGAEIGMGSLVIVVMVPALQWTILVIASLVGVMRRRSSVGHGSST